MAEAETSLRPRGAKKVTSRVKATATEWHVGQETTDWYQARHNCFLLPLMDLDEQEWIGFEGKKRRNRGKDEEDDKNLDPDTQNLSPFSQLDYLTHLSWRNKLQGAERLDVLRKGESPRRKESYTDQDIQDEMFAMLGAMDTSSPKFPKLFDTFKESFLENLADLEFSEETALRLDSSLKSYDGPGPVVKKMNLLFSSQENAMYNRLDPINSPEEADWFVLPRPRKVWGEKFMSKRLLKMLHHKMESEVESKETNGRGDKEDTDSSSGFGESFSDEENNYKRFGSTFKNVLGFYDSFSDQVKTEMPANLSLLDPRYWNFPRQVLNYKDGSNIYIPYALVHKLNELIHRYPGGITTETLFMLYNRDTGHPMEGWATDHASWKLLFETLSDVIYVMYPVPEKLGGTPLLFPKALEEFLPPRTVIDMRITHFMIMAIMLEKKGFVEVDSIPELIWKHFGIRIIYSEWGYKSISEFVQDYLSPIRDYIEVVKFWKKKPDYALVAKQRLHVRSYEVTYVVFQYYVFAAENFETYRRDNEDLAVREQSEYEMYATKSLIVPRQFMRPVEELQSVSESMFPGGVLDCVSLSAECPSYFAVTSVWDVNKLDSLRRVLNEGKWRNNQSQPPNLKQLLALGLPVLVRVPAPRNCFVWCRGVVVRLDDVKDKDGRNKKLIVKVRLVDIGWVATVTELSDIALMPRDFGEKMRTIAVFCKLHFNDPTLKLKQYAEDWKPDEIKIFEELVIGKTLRLRFHSLKNLSLFHYAKNNEIGSSKSEDKFKYKAMVDGTTFTPVGILNLPLLDSRMWTVSGSAIKLAKDGNKVEEVVIPDLAVEFEKRYFELQQRKAEEEANAKKCEVTEKKLEKDGQE